MTAKERIRNILILEEMKENPKEAMRLGIVDLTINRDSKFNTDGRRKKDE